jgi:hypothetical protein
MEKATEMTHSLRSMDDDDDYGDENTLPDELTKQSLPPSQTDS